MVYAGKGKRGGEVSAIFLSFVHTTALSSYKRSYVLVVGASVREISGAYLATRHWLVLIKVGSEFNSLAMPVGASEAFTFTFVFLFRRSARKLWMMPHFVTVRTFCILPEGLIF